MMKKFLSLVFVVLTILTLFSACQNDGKKNAAAVVDTVEHTTEEPNTEIKENEPGGDEKDLEQEENNGSEVDESGDNDKIKVYKIYFNTSLKSAYFNESDNVKENETGGIYHYYIDVTENAQFILPTPFCDGYRFFKWVYASDDGNELKSGKFTFDNDIFLLAVWEGGAAVDTPFA